MHQNYVMQAKHTICLKNLNTRMSKVGYFGEFQRFMHQSQKCRQNTIFKVRL
ncbi:hypothetical protein E2C01_059819 [Portunus trituberculatus]|uniref:Uncharacterized protein n=1 Tax=Portunus trituberculatus TaxID=210409 RepID=A0A5B7H6F1_PORTR|nr:hypothetical protein [Portunus trituberculatus]